jgi:hypothetical protein
MSRWSSKTIGLALGAVAVMAVCLAIQYGAATREGLQKDLDAKGPSRGETADFFNEFNDTAKYAKNVKLYSQKSKDFMNKAKAFFKYKKGEKIYRNAVLYKNIEIYKWLVSPDAGVKDLWYNESAKETVDNKTIDSFATTLFKFLSVTPSYLKGEFEQGIAEAKRLTDLNNASIAAAAGPTATIASK